MIEKPEALRLADLLEMGHDLRDEEAAAAELRRLHESNGKLFRALELAASFICMNRTEDNDWRLHESLFKLLKAEGGDRHAGLL
jgi:hypothetical protein